MVCRHLGQVAALPQTQGMERLTHFSPFPTINTYLQGEFCIPFVKAARIGGLKGLHFFDLRKDTGLPTANYKLH